MNKIYVFGDLPENCIYYAVADDGVILQKWFCSDDNFAKYDLAVNKDKFRESTKKIYDEHFKGGYEVEFIPYNEFNDAFELNKILKLMEEKNEKEAK